MLSHKPGGLKITSCNPKEMYNSTILWDCIEWNKSFGKALKLQKGLENPSIPSCSGKTNDQVHYNTVGQWDYTFWNFIHYGKKV